MNHNCFVFSQSEHIRCCAFLNDDLIILAGQSKLTIFEVAEAKLLVQANFDEQQCNPIQIITVVVEKGSHIIVQGKMGNNLIFQFHENCLKQVGSYSTGVCGFAKMQTLGQMLFGIRDEHHSIGCFSILEGNLLHEWILEQPKLAESITCYILRQQQDAIHIIMGQEGWLINEFVLGRPSPGEKQILVDEPVRSLQIPASPQEIKIVLAMQSLDGIVYVTLRKDPHIFVLSQTLLLITKVATECKMIKDLKLMRDHTIIFCDGAKLLKGSTLGWGQKFHWNPGEHNIKLMGEAKQSKNINCIAGGKHGVACSTDEQQFLYIQL